MNNQTFFEDLRVDDNQTIYGMQQFTLEEGAEALTAYAKTHNDVQYHGSPFSPAQLSEVFIRNGSYPEGTSALVPVQPYHLNNEGQREPFGEPSVSAGTVADALSRAFLNSKALHLRGIENSSGFASSGVLDSYEIPVTVIPQAMARALRKHEAAAYVYAADTTENGFSPVQFATREDARRDQYEQRSPYIVRPLGAFAITFQEFVALQPIVVTDTNFAGVKELEQRIAEGRQAEDPSVDGARDMRDHFRRYGIGAEMLSDFS
jgi:hypothetical protein